MDEVVIACPGWRTPARARLRPPHLPAPACCSSCWVAGPSPAALAAAAAATTSGKAAWG